MKVRGTAGHRQRRLELTRLGGRGDRGDPWAEVVGGARAGPLLPADAATNTPAAYASRNASSTGSVNGSRAAGDREVDHVDAVEDGLLRRQPRSPSRSSRRCRTPCRPRRTRPARCRGSRRGRHRAGWRARRPIRRWSMRCGCRALRCRGRCPIGLRRVVRQIGGQECLTADQLVVADERRRRAGVSGLSPKSHGRPGCRRVSAAGPTARVGEGRVLRPDTGVEHTDDHALACGGVRPRRVVQRRARR